MLMKEHYGAQSLQEKFGKHDFTFEGNRTYKNYILDYDGLIIIAPSKREVVLTDNMDFEKIINFEKNYSQLVLNYIFKNQQILSDYEKKHLNRLQESGILNENFQINFDEPNKINKIKILGV